MTASKAATYADIKPNITGRVRNRQPNAMSLEISELMLVGAFLTSKTPGLFEYENTLLSWGQTLSCIYNYVFLLT